MALDLVKDAEPSWRPQDGGALDKALLIRSVAAEYAALRESVVRRMKAAGLDVSLDVVTCIEGVPLDVMAVMEAKDTESRPHGAGRERVHARLGEFVPGRQVFAVASVPYVPAVPPVAQDWRERAGVVVAEALGVAP